jgi:hypothetical protein
MTRSISLSSRALSDSTHATGRTHQQQSHRVGRSLLCCEWVGGTARADVRGAGREGLEVHHQRFGL